MGDDARVYAGVDAHKDKHVLCVLDWMGRKVLTEEFFRNSTTVTAANSVPFSVTSTCTFWRTLLM